MTPITKNGSDMIRVFDVHGNELEATYPKRAKGLVRKGRAQWLSSVNHDDPDFVPDSIILYDEEPSADSTPRTADIQQTEVQSMLFFNTNNDPDTTSEIPAEEPENAEIPQSEIDPDVQKMIDDFKVLMSKARADMAQMQDEAQTAFTEARLMKSEAESLLSKAKAAVKGAYHKAADAISAKKEEAASVFDTDLEEDEYSGVSFPDFGEIPEVPEAGSADQTDFTEVLTEILDMLDDIGERELSGDPDIAKIESDHLAALSDSLREVYKQTLAAMEQSRRDAAQAQAHTRRQQLLEEQIRRMEDDKNRQITIVSQLFRDEKITLDEMLAQTSHISSGYNDRILLIINQMK